MRGARDIADKITIHDYAWDWSRSCRTQFSRPVSYIFIGYYIACNKHGAAKGEKRAGWLAISKCVSFEEDRRLVETFVFQVEVGRISQGQLRHFKRNVVSFVKQVQWFVAQGRWQLEVRGTKRCIEVQLMSAFFVTSAQSFDQSFVPTDVTRVLYVSCTGEHRTRFTNSYYTTG